ncbi:methyl-accepting chemotaxis protein [Massilia sp. erpn]|uniref:methyl-accepting chemotaxis protein n=1 Tax=Massilia sp. erpn TaxID=2738142 RepID=UPI0021068E24|nr:methyl-accepting chemotaxis protein [Massilia sp. erpn]
MKFANMNIGARLGLSFGLVTLLLAMIVTIALSQMSQAADRMSNMLDDRYYKIDLANQIKQNVITIHKYMRNSLLAADEAGVKREADAMNALRAKNKDLLEKFDKVINVPKAREIFTNITTARAQDLANQQNLLRLIGELKLDDARKLINGQISESEKKYVGYLEEMSDLQEGRMAEESKMAKESFGGARVQMLTIAGVTIAVTIVIGWLASGSITRPLNDAVGLARRVADGDLSAQIEVKSSNETGQLLAALRDMNDSLGRIVRQVRSGTDTMVTASQEIATGNHDLSSRTERQASALEETASSMEELTGTVKLNAANATQSNELAQSASEVAQRGKSVVAQVVDTMGAINESSRKIVDIIAVIDGIAFQTNILALNAAVEAARAGEQGRGFAVVASEVRNLAQRSAAAAKEIKTLIGNSVEQVDAGAQLVSQAGHTMDEVVSSVERVTAIIGEITHASKEQSAGLEQINQAIVEMDDVTQQNAALVEQAAAAAQSMQEQARSLSELVGVFRLDASAASRALPGPSRLALSA